MTATDLLTHRRLLQCRRGTLGTTIDTKLSQGIDVKCETIKMKLLDGMLRVLCSYNTTATLNCLTNDEVCKIINYCYKLLPEEC